MKQKKGRLILTASLIHCFLKHLLCFILKMKRCKNFGRFIRQPH